MVLPPPLRLSFSISIHERVSIRRKIRNLKNQIRSISRTLIDTRLRILTEVLMLIEEASGARSILLNQRQGKTGGDYTHIHRHFSSLLHQLISSLIIVKLGPSTSFLSHRYHPPFLTVFIMLFAGLLLKRQHT